MDIIIKEKEVHERLSTYHNREDLLRFLVKHGDKVPVLHPTEKREEFLVPGCLSKLWLKAETSDGRVYYEADAESKIVKGITALLIEIYNGRTVEEIVNHKCHFGATYPFKEFLPKSKRSSTSRLIDRIYELAEVNAVSALV